METRLYMVFLWYPYDQLVQPIIPLEHYSTPLSSLLQDGGDRERRTRLFARDRTTSGSKGKKNDTPRTPGAAPEQMGGPVHTESSVSVCHNLSNVKVILKNTGWGLKTCFS